MHSNDELVIKKSGNCEYGYDSAGNEVYRKMYSMYGTVVGQINSRYVDNRLVLREYVNDNSRIISHYDDFGREVIRESCNLLDGTNSTNEFSYDSAGRLVGSKMSNKKNGYTERQYITYDADGHIIGDVSYSGYSYKTENTYDINGNKISSKSYVQDRIISEETLNQDGTRNVTQFMYDEKGNLIGKDNEIFGVNLNSKENHVYDDNGHLIASRSYRDDGTFSELRFVLDEQGNPMSSTIYEYDGNKVTISKQGQYVKDENGEYHLSTYNEYDKDGRIIHVHNDDGRDIKCNYDEQGMLRSITLNGIECAFNATELKTIISSITSSRVNFDTTLANISSICGNVASVVASADSGLNSSLNRLSQVCDACKELTIKLLDKLVVDILNFISKTVANEEAGVESLRGAESSLGDISSLLDSIN